MRTWLALVAMAGPALVAPTASAESPAAPDPLAEVALGVELPRYLQVGRTPAGGEVEVVVDNRSGAGLRVGGLAVRSVMFDDESPSRVTHLVPAGRRIDFRIPLGAVRCDTAGRRVAVTVVVGDPDAPVRSVAVDAGPLQRLHDRECATLAVAERVDLRLGMSFAATPAGADAELTLHRRQGDGPVAVSQVRGSVLFTLWPDPPGPPVLALPPGTAAASTTVHVDAVRCDPHALIESKKTFRFSAWVSVDDAEPVWMELQPEPALRDLLQHLLDSCLAPAAGG